MAVNAVDVGSVPVDVAGHLGLGPSVVAVENASVAPVWILPLEGVGEPAPADRVGHLLLPGERVDVQIRAAGAPLWVWSQGPAAVVVGPRME